MNELAERCRKYETDKYTLCYWVRDTCMTHSEWDSTGDRIITPATAPTIIHDLRIKPLGDIS